MLMIHGSATHARRKEQHQRSSGCRSAWFVVGSYCVISCGFLSERKQVRPVTDKSTEFVGVFCESERASFRVP